MYMQGHERHIGRNISRIRELLGIKQETLALSVGLSQQSVSVIEKNAFVDDEKVLLFADALQVSPNVLKNFDERKLLDYFDKLGNLSVENSIPIAQNELFHRLLEAFEANNRLHDEKYSLYERLLETEKEKIRYLETIANLRGQNSKSA
ncbi:helix-turn-helix domain-containing protein [Flavobacterium sp.]|uniref:helix-turn-helix domain-containing protein n=1 Tax=Flavobacterium sp. TaxID=239 RepID=UPI001217EDE1|nr:helix-turn-helix domain-containing protein [Flavobacterium sp.]RZJ71468.1 MAG: XRE family transcriptional regulator [Flavobacterium sp.]